MFNKSGVTMWEWRNCGHIVVGTSAPDVCLVCNHPLVYFEVGLRITKKKIYKTKSMIVSKFFNVILSW